MLSLLANNLGMTVEAVELFSLALVRIATLVFVLPFLGIGGVIPTQVKAGFAFFLALIAYPQLPHVGFAIANSPIFFFMLVIEQVMVGVIIGFTATYIFHFIVIGSEFMTRDIGLSPGSITDPIRDDAGDEIGVLIVLILSIAFLVRGFHHYFIMVIIDSFQYIPIGRFNWEFLPVARVLCLMSGAALLTGVKLAAPVMITMLLTTLGMGLMSRIMPAMNVWIVAQPLKIVVGVIIIWQVFPLMTMLFDENFLQVQEGISYLLRHGAVSG